MDKIGMIDYDGKTIKTDKMRKNSGINRGREVYAALSPVVNWKKSMLMSVNMSISLLYWKR